MLEKTFEPSDIETRQYTSWEKSGAFKASLDDTPNPFCVMMPPPNVTGSLHMGHALNMTLQDILTRYWRMKGRDSLWQPGTDHAGIATQMVVERQLDEQGVKRHDLGRQKFLDRVWEWKAESGGTIVNQLRRLGATPDWERERFTMDEGLSRAVTKVFVQLYEEGLIYKDKRLVNWDPKLKTAISDLEVEQKEIKGHMWHIAYPVEGEEARSITVATTRPETMLGDTAIAVHPEDERYQDLIGKCAVLPIIGRLIPIVADEYSDPEKGSGAVKITPAHDFNDFEVGKRHDLPMINVFDENASMNENVPEQYQGLDRFDARKKVLQELEEQDLIKEVENIVHVVPYGDRGGVIIEPFLTDQWYVDAKTLAKPAIEAVEQGKTVFVPKSWENTYFEWMCNIQPWCISRQLWWGHQIPAWYGPDNDVFVAYSEEEAYEKARAKHGENVELKRDEDVLDTWFSSALWPFSTLGWPDKTPELDRFYPGSVLITGFDIIFFWVSRMMMMGLHFMKEVPFKDVYIHALVRDSKGQKMSKSKGNIIDPLDLIEKFGADALRFTLTAMAAQGRDIKLSEERVAGYRNFATKLWNAARFCEMNNALPQEGYDPTKAEHPINQWIIGAVYKTAQDVGKAVEQYKFNEAANAIYQFVWGEFCDWYLEFSKPLLAEGSDPKIAQEVRATCGWVLDQILILLNPFMPYLTEELYATIAKRESGNLLLQASWPEYDSTLSYQETGKEVDWLTRFIAEIRSVRADMNVPPKAMVTLLVKGSEAQTQEKLKEYSAIIQQLARLESLEVYEGDIPKGSVQTVLDDAVLIMPIADIVDIGQERERLQTRIEKLQKDIAKIDQKLGDQKFVSNAPNDVVEEQRSRKIDAENILGKLSQALKQLEAA